MKWLNKLIKRMAPKPRLARIYDTSSSSGLDTKLLFEGEVLGTVREWSFGIGVMYYRILLKDNTYLQIPVDSTTTAPDGVLEYRV